MKTSAGYRLGPWELPWEIDDEECVIDIVEIYGQRPRPWTDTSDWDALGFFEATYRILDKQGLPSAELDGKIGENEDKAIQKAIEKHIDNPQGV